MIWRKYRQLSIVLLMACGFLISQGCQTPNDETKAIFQLQWSTFPVGGRSVRDIAVDSMGNIYIVGGGYDAFVAKLDANGTLQWNTFLGLTENDQGKGIAVDGNGNIYMIGRNYVAKLDASGALHWHTPIDEDVVEAIAVDNQGNIYVVGYDECIEGCADIFNVNSVYKFNANGVEEVMTSPSDYYWMDVHDIAVDSNNNIYLTGSFDDRSFVGKLDLDTKTKEEWQWISFLGERISTEKGIGITLDKNGNIYVTGKSDSTWGNPLNPFCGGSDAFLAKLNAGNGTLQWNTFLGGGSNDRGTGIAFDENGNIYVSGISTSTWGSPLDPYHGGGDAFVAELSANGALQQNTFLGGSGDDTGRISAIDYAEPCIALDNAGNIYISGNSDSTWGSPLSPHNGGLDAFVAKLTGYKLD